MSDLTPKLDAIAAHGNRGHATDSINAPRGGSQIRCADGSVLSVIAGGGTYCQPRPAMCTCSLRGELEPFASTPLQWEVAHDYPGPYTHVEVMPIEGDWPAEWFDGDSVATVAVENVRAEFAKRGGEADRGCPHTLAE